jgi:hypothetical protein
MAVERFKCCENIEWLAKELSVPRQTLYRWYGESERNAEDGEPIPEKSRESRLRREARELKRLIAKRPWSWIFSKAPCRKSRPDVAGAAGLASWHLRPHPGRDVAARRSGHRADVLSCGRKQSWFLSLPGIEDPWQEEMDVRSEVQRIALEHRGRYGYRRVTAELRNQGMSVNHKRVARLLREDNLVGTERLQRLDDSARLRDRGEPIA